MYSLWSRVTVPILLQVSVEKEPLVRCTVSPELRCCLSINTTCLPPVFCSVPWEIAELVLPGLIIPQDRRHVIKY